MKDVDRRPVLNNKISIVDFRDFYWLKAELAAFCRAEGLKVTGSKVELFTRIETYLKTGKQETKSDNVPKPLSTFNWHSEHLTLHTIITDSYKNSQNVRRFFKQHIGEHFKFNVRFMGWMKSNIGKTLKEAIEEWVAIKAAIEKESKQQKKKKIAPQFEYNSYLRDFLADNKDLNRETGIKLWKIKKSLRGDNVYNKNDLKWL